MDFVEPDFPKGKAARSGGLALPWDESNMCFTIFFGGAGHRQTHP